MTIKQLTCFHLGKKHGAIWAGRNADPQQLHRLQELMHNEQVCAAAESIFDNSMDTSWSPSDVLAFVIHDTEPARFVSNDFWYDAADGVDHAVLHSSHFARGFVAGAFEETMKSRS